ncbi:hypothetical protein [Paludisphaera mucosa]|uniref:Antitoxin VbhA domain-containing protein n=1 Tax=Paludisphaera mucosa TaxID=3030827 RepID=A0ABT6FCI1_9BACT|nr:hypothetical protein [Paludisphaera mucosa]MDG3005098.1 hypothetical protein [Paludisphaera mucosa]
MQTDRFNDPVAFRDFLDAKLAGAPPDFTLHDALAQWELENQADRGESLAAVRRGFESLEAGKTVDAFEFVERMRRKIRPLPPR